MNVNKQNNLRYKIKARAELDQATTFEWASQFQLSEIHNLSLYTAIGHQNGKISVMSTGNNQTGTKTEIELMNKEAMTNERSVKALSWNKYQLAAAYETYLKESTLLIWDISM